MRKDTLYDHTELEGEGALAPLKQAGQRIAEALTRCEAQPPKPLTLPKITPLRDFRIPASGVGVSLVRSAIGWSADLNDGDARGSVGRKILATTMPQELLRITEEVEREATTWEAAADEREREVAEAVETALESEDEAIRSIAQRLEAQRRAEAAAAAEQVAWIREHGSERLRWLMDERIECDAVYRDERLAHDRPGWAYYDELPGEIDEPRNPGLEARELLARARELEPQAVLVRYRAPHECHEACDEGGDCSPRFDVVAYVAEAEFLGRTIVYGLS